MNIMWLFLILLIPLLSGCSEEIFFFDIGNSTIPVYTSLCPSNAMCEEFNINISVYYDNNTELTGVAYERFET